MISDFRPVKRPASKPIAPTPTPPQSETFRTPEAVAADASPLDMKLDPSPPHETTKTKSRFRLQWPPPKKLLGIIAGAAILITAGACYFLTHQPLTEPTQKIVAVKKKPTTVPSTLTGLPVKPEVNQEPVTGVMVENSIYARPQAGLSEAGVVFEAIAEGGITRFLALYQDTAPNNVGPIRSARPYYARWALGFDAGYAHVGGSPEALADIKKWKVRDLDQFYNAGSYHRVSSREAPHNVYTGIPTLNKLEAGKGYNTSSYSGFARKKDKPLATPTANGITIAISGPDYNVAYHYDKASNRYLRDVGGAAHIDANTKRQIRPNVVIGLVIPYSLASDGYHSNYANIGSGVAYIFQDGGVTKATWSKAGNTTQISFTDATGKALKLNAGQTWLTAVGKATDITYTP